MYQPLKFVPTGRYVSILTILFNRPLAMICVYLISSTADPSAKSRGRGPNGFLGLS